jgi:hypothetical protein
MMRSTGFTAVCACLAALVAAPSGGCSDPAAAKATAMRVQRLRQTAALYPDREADSPRRLKSTIDVARRIEKHHAERTVQNRECVRRWFERDVRRWTANQPVYRQDIARRFKGKPSAIPRAAIAMFY